MSVKTPEGKVKEAVKKVLQKYKVYYHMPVQNGMGRPSLDFVCCHQGLFFAIETKAADKQPSERQTITIREMIDAGGVVFVINEVNEVLSALEDWLIGVTQQQHKYEGHNRVGLLVT